MKRQKLKVSFIVLLIILMFSQASTKRQVQNDPFYIQTIWQQISQTGIIEKIIKTNFLQGIKAGKLDPWCFSKYAVQDLQYMNKSVQLWERSCKDGARDAQFSRFCNLFNTSQHNYYNLMKKKLFISSAEPMEVIINYTDDERKAYQRNTYHYIAVINYACLKVYNSIGVKLLPEANRHSPYFDWLQSNAIYDNSKDLQSTINYYQSYFDRQQVKKDIQMFVNYELELFKVSCPSTSKTNLLRIQ